MKEIREYAFERLQRTPDHLDLRANEECEMTEGQTCVICGQPLKIGWTILHGVADCVYCGAPYVVYHRNKEGKLISRTPVPNITPELIPRYAEAWRKAETYGEFLDRIRQITKEAKKKIEV